MFDFTDKVVIVTGAGSGIGKGIALSFAKAGAKVSIWEMNLPAAQDTAIEIAGNSGQAIALKVDTTSTEDVEAAVGTTLEAFGGRIDVLVNNAGIMSKVAVKNCPPESPEDWRKVIDINLTGPYICSRAVFPIMRRQKYGKIVNISSIAGKRISAARAVSYSASKAGEIGLTRHLAMEGGAFGITVNAICPGGTRTAMLESIATPEELADRATKIPTGRLATPQDIANLAMFLASDLAGQITGQAIDVDGGQLIYWHDREAYFKGMD